MDRQKHNEERDKSEKNKVEITHIDSSKSVGQDRRVRDDGWWRNEGIERKKIIIWEHLDTSTQTWCLTLFKHELIQCRSVLDLLTEKTWFLLNDTETDRIKVDSAFLLCYSHCCFVRTSCSVPFLSNSASVSHRLHFPEPHSPGFTCLDMSSWGYY